MTDAEKQQLADAFFKDRLTPAAEALRKRGVRFFPPAPDAEADTYFESRDPNAPLIVEIDLDDAAALLAQMWAAQDLPELADLAAELVELAKSLKQEEQDSGDISPFIYEMF